MTTKTIELAKKLAELARRGVDGEKINAEIALHRIMAKYGITLQDIEEESTHRHWFSYKGNMELILGAQIIYAVTGSRDAYKKGNKWFGADMTTSQRIEIEFQYSLYRKDLKKHLDTFFHAFVIKNHIFPKVSQGKSTSEMTPEEYDALRRAEAMASGIKRTDIHKQLKSA